MNVFDRKLLISIQYIIEEILEKSEVLYNDLVEMTRKTKWTIEDKKLVYDFLIKEYVKKNLSARVISFYQLKMPVGI